MSRTLISKGRQQSRRDDMISLAYMLYYFLMGGSLPWTGIGVVDKYKRRELMMQIKEEISTKELNEGHPEEFVIYTR